MTPLAQGVTSMKALDSGCQVPPKVAQLGSPSPPQQQPPSPARAGLFSSLLIGRQSRVSAFSFARLMV